MDYPRQIERLQKRIANLEQELYTDELTGILNRRGLMTLLNPVFDAVAFERAHPRKRRNVVITALAVVFVDIDHFKKVNDTFGHAAGDAALKEVAGRLKHGTRGMDIVGRYGGEEMIVGLLGANQDDAMKIAEQLRADIEKTPVIVEHATMQVTASFGVAELTSEPTLDKLLEKADQALYQAKQTGRNKVVAAA